MCDVLIVAAVFQSGVKIVKIVLADIDNIEAFIVEITSDPSRRSSSFFGKHFRNRWPELLRASTTPGSQMSRLSVSLHISSVVHQ